MDISIIIVNYCTYDLTKQTTQSVINTVYNLTYEIIIVDNASSDDSLKRLKHDFKDNSTVKFIANDKNAGFAVANNLALKKSEGDYILLLNSDVIVKKDTINDCLKYLKSDKSIGMLGCKVSLPNGKLDKACRRSFPTFEVSFYRMVGLSKLFPNSPKFNQYNLSYLNDNGVYEVDCIVGAFMLLPKDLILSCGGLDESYFMYGEDIELCYQIKEQGYKVVYYGKQEIIHYKGASGSNKYLLYEFHNSMQIFYDKHYKSVNNFIVNYITYFGIWGLYYIKSLKFLFK